MPTGPGESCGATALALFRASVRGSARAEMCCTTTECMVLESNADLWHIRRMERAGYGFTYDWPLGVRGRQQHGSSIASCIAKAHVDAFSAEHIVGDPTWWNKIIKAPIPGYGWARRARALRCV